MANPDKMNDLLFLADELTKEAQGLTELQKSLGELSKEEVNLKDHMTRAALGLRFTVARLEGREDEGLGIGESDGKLEDAITEADSAEG